MPGDQPSDPNAMQPDPTGMPEMNAGNPSNPSANDDNPMENQMSNEPSDGADGPDTTPTMNENMDQDDAPVFEVDTLVERIATATCQVMNTCCQGNEIESYWRSIANNPRFEDVADMLPPNAEYDPETCVEDLSAAFEIAPFGGWVDAVRTGVVQYDAEAAELCLETLENAECGDELNQALFCLLYTSPSPRD